jgi:D-tagatose-1,6-bisphosphate aldolase subunit GatZ/KbaZ
MSCAGDPVPLSDEIVSERAAILCKVAEDTWQKVGGEAPVYVVGTEVPVPGGAQEDLDEDLVLTTKHDAKKTLDIHKLAFDALGLSDAWQRVIALVVQPGVEFDHHKVIHYNSEKATELSKFTTSNSHIVYEAHSTDYQKDQAYSELVKDHFAILKVGPALTYALREAAFALDAIEREWLGEENASQIRSVLMQAMNDKPVYWESYYHNELDIEFSFSDRSRYYWSEKTVVAALDTLDKNLSSSPAPLTLISQYLPVQYKAICNNEITNTPHEIILHKIMEVNSAYNKACMI